MKDTLKIKYDCGVKVNIYFTFRNSSRVALSSLKCASNKNTI